VIVDLSEIVSFQRETVPGNNAFGFINTESGAQF